MATPAEDFGKNGAAPNAQRGVWASAAGQVLEAQNRWLDRLSDPEWGAVGPRLRDAWRAAGGRETLDMAEYLAGYGGYVDRVGPRRAAIFRNTITYGPAALEQPEILFACRAHEIVHGLQAHASAARHAMVFGRDVPVLLCPQDYILLAERMEEDAYAKQTWLCALAAQDSPRLDKVNDGRLHAFKANRAAFGLTEALKIAARAAMAVPVAAGGERKSRREVYRQEWLSEYRKFLAYIRRSEKAVFVRLTAADVKDVGESFGPNPFTGPSGTVDPAFFGLADLTPDERRQIDELNALAGIGDDTALPTLGQALKNFGLDRQGFLTRSRGENAPSAPPPRRPAP